METDKEISATPEVNTDQTKSQTEAPSGPKLQDEEHAYNEKAAHEIHLTGSDTDSSYDVRKENHFGEAVVVSDAKELVTHVLHVDECVVLAVIFHCTEVLNKSPVTRA